MVPSTYYQGYYLVNRRTQMVKEVIAAILIGGLVSCRSVKLLDGLQEDDDTRDIWWQDIRKEVRSHARSLGCNLIVGYTEDTVIWYFNMFLNF